MLEVDNSIILVLIYIHGFYHLFSGILFDNFLDKWEGKISEVSASIVPTLMHVLFNTISKLISILRICNRKNNFYYQRQ